MFNLQPFLDLINSKCCTHEYNILNFSDLEKVDKTFFKNTKYQSEKKTPFFSKIILVPMSYITYYICIIYVLYICIIYVLYVFLLAFAGFSWVFLRPRRFLYVLLLAVAGFSWVFCVRGDICMCFCWLFLSFWNPSWADLQLGRTSNSVLPKSVLGGPPTRD